ncbi:recombination regulator RecX [Burkholderia gladioli]|uniref:recombination regulator RecX n=1 Tax=Burkholderia gladioli TaxID=28095 RepID=UPI00163FA97C|nr:recombination regulator RecX [Burkholderia gladioli]
MRRSRGRPDDSPASSPREPRAGDGGQADRPGPAPVLREGRPAGRPETRASDDALVSFQRPRRAAADPVYASDSVDADESFDAHDVARGIRARSVRAVRGEAGRAAPAVFPADAGASSQPRRQPTAGRIDAVAGPRPAASQATVTGGRPASLSRRRAAPDPFEAPAAPTHFENADGDQYSRTSEHATRRNRRRTRGPFDERDASTASSGQATEPAGESAGESRRTERERPTRTLKGRALGYLSRREYSRSELARKLAPYVEEGDAPEALLDALEREGWLSDARFTESLVHRRASRLGTARILGELKRHAVDSELVESVSEQLRETEFGRAQAVWRKKFGSLPGTPAERAKQARFLAARGFTSATIVKLLKGGEDEFGEF